MDFIKQVLEQPLNSLAALAAMAVIAWSLLSLRQAQNRHTRVLLAIVGFAGVLHGLHLTSTREGALNLTVACLYLAAVAWIRRLNHLHRTTEYALRLAEGNQALAYDASRRRIAISPLSNPTGTAAVQSAFDALPAPMFAVNLDGYVSCWNLAAERALGWKQAEVLGRKLPDLILDDTSNPVRLVRKDGSPIDGRQVVHSVPIRDARGSVSGILTILSI
jgi:PAS domain-containing protein